jgi:hypothetical protein
MSMKMEDTVAMSRRCQVPEKDSANAKPTGVKGASRQSRCPSHGEPPGGKSRPSKNMSGL